MEAVRLAHTTAVNSSLSRESQAMDCEIAVGEHPISGQTTCTCESLTFRSRGHSLQFPGLRPRVLFVDHRPFALKTWSSSYLLLIVYVKGVRTDFAWFVMITCYTTSVFLKKLISEINNFLTIHETADMGIQLGFNFSFLRCLYSWAYFNSLYHYPEYARKNDKTNSILKLIRTVWSYRAMNDK